MEWKQEKVSRHLEGWVARCSKFTLCCTLKKVHAFSVIKISRRTAVDYNTKYVVQAVFFRASAYRLSIMRTDPRILLLVQVVVRDALGTPQAIFFPPNINENQTVEFYKYIKIMHVAPTVLATIKCGMIVLSLRTDSTE